VIPSLARTANLFAKMEFLAELWDNATAPFDPMWYQGTVCAVLVGAVCGVLGVFFVLRSMALIGDALSHAILPGVVVAYMVFQSSNVLILLGGAMVAGLLSAVSMNVVNQYSRTKNDSAIGIVFTAFFALGIILISSLPRGTHFDMKCFLFGEPLAVQQADMWAMLVIAPIVIGLIALLYHPLKLVSFDPVVAAAMGLKVVAFHYLLMAMLSVTVVAGLKTTGVVLVVAMLITPASAAYQLTNRLSTMLVLSAVFGGVSGVLGMSVAFITNSPTGPAIVLVASVFFIAAMLFSPTHGLVFDRVRRWKLAGHIQTEDVLKGIYQLSQAGGCTMPQLIQRLDMPPGRVRAIADRLTREGLVLNNGTLTLSPDGQRHAIEMVRSHRLWETYLADRMALDNETVHTEAERLEHAHDLSDQLDELLGQPTVDPHGSEIPSRPE
jgi:ABC-type Mn2+/Zn2+ transport system permease subunit/Mn-dependent DtxR family transcriptional regulator